MSASHVSSGTDQAQHGATQRYSENNAAADVARMSLGNHQLSQRQLNAIELLLRGLGDAQVAQQVGVDRGTVFRWRKNKPFAMEMDRQRRMVCERSAARLQTMLEPALDILQKQIGSTDEKIALRAAAILLRIASPARIQRIADSNNASEKKSSSDSFDEALDAYVNAPMPTDPRYAEAMRQIQEKFGADDADENESGD